MKKRTSSGGDLLESIRAIVEPLGGIDLPAYLAARAYGANHRSSAMIVTEHKGPCPRS